MKQTRWIALLLALVMVLGLLPGTALAAEEKNEKKESGYEQLSFRVNPLYEGLIDVDDYLTSEITAPRLEVDQLYASYVTVDKAATTLRDAMEARKASVELHVKYESTDYNELIEKIFIKAFEHTGTPTEGDSLQWQYAGWSGQVSYEFNDSTDMVEHDFVIDIEYYTTAAQEKELTNAVDDLLDDLNVSKKSDYQKVCAVYDYICDNITYDYENLEDDSYTLKFSAYAALINKTAVCQGYALLFYRLMLELDVDARLIAGDGGGPHAWNIVKLDDVYYNLDSTWDAGVSDYQFFLLNTENFVDHARYLDYMTTQFHTDYPMSATDYVDGVEGEPEYYFVIGQCGDNAFFGVNRDRELVIAGEGTTYSSYEVDDLGIVIWDFWVDGFDTVVVDEGITRLGESAFQDMVNITAITLPDSLLEIGQDAFEGCEGLSSVVIPDRVTTIDDGAFWCCYNLGKVTLGKAVAYIGDQAFRECRALTNIVIPDSVTTLGHMAFYANPNLKTVTMGDSVTDIPSYCFGECTSLETITLPEGLTRINPAGFQSCRSLKEIAFPAGVISVDGFAGCTALNKITFVGDAPDIGYYAFEDVTATVYYPGDNPTWTDDKLSDYGGNLTWVSTHTHSYTSKVTAPTCTEKGYTTYTCSCGNSYKDNYVNALGHSYGEPEFVGKDEGHSYECTRCGVTKTESCTFDAGTVVKEATMEDFGIVRYTCTVCGGSYEAEVVYRIAGKGRSETAIEVADMLKEKLGINKFNTIIIASGEEFADALAGSYLAIKKDAPILLSCKYSVEMNEEYISRNLASGGTVYILGGTAEKAVPAYVEESLVALGYKVIRLAGSDRYETNLMILEEAGVDGEEILVCTGWGFGDSLSASATGLPILMVNAKNGQNSALTAAQTEFLSAHASNNVTIIGGTAAIGDGMLQTIDKIVTGKVERISGSSREDTSVKVAEKYFDSPDTAFVAYAWNFPDGLCGGPLAHAYGAPLLLVNPRKEAVTADYLKGEGIATGAILGGTAAVSDASARILFGLE